MLNNVSKLEIVIEDKLYQFFTDSNASLTHVRDALTRFIAFTYQYEELIKQKEREAAMPKDQNKDADKEMLQMINESYKNQLDDIVRSNDAI